MLSVEFPAWQGKRHCPVLSSGKIGFRQMAPMIGEYCNLKVHAIEVENA